MYVWKSCIIISVSSVVATIEQFVTSGMCIAPQIFSVFVLNLKKGTLVTCFSWLGTKIKQYEISFIIIFFH